MSSIHILAFLSLCVLTLVPAVMVVTTRNLVHAGFWLLPCLIGVAGFYALLEAHVFVAVQVLIYVGAILVLILFALMLTRDVMDPKEPQANRLVWWAAGSCGAAMLITAHILFHHPWRTTGMVPMPAAQQTAELGRALIGRYAMPFEVASVILLAALVGAIVVARGPRRDAAASIPAGEDRP